jgi:hypothetical protein
MGTTVKVKDLKVGDELGNCTIVDGPVYIGNYCGQKDRANVQVRYSNGKESWRIWGNQTTVKVTNR